MPHDIQPLPGAEGWQISNLPILAAAPLLASLPLFDSRGDACAARQIAAADRPTWKSLLRAQLADSLTIITPTDPEARGCQLSLRLQRSPSEARKVFDALEAAGFIGDWREPDVIRVSARAAVQHVRSKRGSSPRRLERACDERRIARAARAGDDRRRRPRRNVARDAARAPRPSGAHLRADAGHAQLHDPGRPLDQSRSCRARHSSAGARRRNGSRATAADPDARSHAARHRRRADVRAVRPRRARSHLLGLAARPQPHPDRRRGARGRRHSVSHCRRRRGHSSSQPGVARRGRPDDWKNVRCSG